MISLVLVIKIPIEHDYEHEQEGETRFRFRLARGKDRRLLCPRIMRLFVGKCVAIFSGAFLILICSCEKHRLGEMPAVQREHVELAKAADDTVPLTEESKPFSELKATPTPAEFFPEKTPH
jgi:hypothetical protein